MSKILVWMFVLGMTLSFVLCYPQQQHQQGLVQRNGNPRTNRGFQLQTGKLSTARGFGKRGGDPLASSQSAAGMSSWDTVGSPLNFDTRGSYPNSWLVDELQTNPETARLVVDKFVDENGDGELTPEELLRRNFF